MKRGLAAVLTVVLWAALAFAQTNNGTLRGRVVDALGAGAVGAQVTIGAAQGVAQRTAQTNQSGEFSLDLPAGVYSVRVASPGFALYENARVEVSAGRAASLDVALIVAETQAEVTIGEESPVNTNPENNAGALVLRDRDIEALPDNDADLEAALRALAGPGAGPNGGEIFVDGFSGGRVPSRNSIREVRVNQNPFSSEYYPAKLRARQRIFHRQPAAFQEIRFRRKAK